jgi:hypothetical protein
MGYISYCYFEFNICGFSTLICPILGADKSKKQRQFASWLYSSRPASFVTPWSCATEGKISKKLDLKPFANKC